MYITFISGHFGGNSFHLMGFLPLSPQCLELVVRKSMCGNIIGEIENSQTNKKQTKNTPNKTPNVR